MTTFGNAAPKVSIVPFSPNSEQFEYHGVICEVFPDSDGLWSSITRGTPQGALHARIATNKADAKRFCRMLWWMARMPKYQRCVLKSGAI